LLKSKFLRLGSRNIFFSVFPLFQDTD